MHKLKRIDSWFRGLWRLFLTVIHSDRGCGAILLISLIQVPGYFFAGPCSPGYHRHLDGLELTPSLLLLKGNTGFSKDRAWWIWSHGKIRSFIPGCTHHAYLTRYWLNGSARPVWTVAFGLWSSSFARTLILIGTYPILIDLCPSHIQLGIQGGMNMQVYRKLIWVIWCAEVLVNLDLLSIRSLKMHQLILKL